MVETSAKLSDAAPSVSPVRSAVVRASAAVELRHAAPIVGAICDDARRVRVVVADRGLAPPVRTAKGLGDVPRAGRTGTRGADRDL